MMDTVANSGDGIETQQTIEFRQSQSIISRLAEYTTGIRSENPGMGKFLVKEHDKYRREYGLPAEILKVVRPDEYEGYLKNLMAELGVKVVDKVNFKDFFKDHPTLNAAYFLETRTIAFDTRRETDDMANNFVRLSAFEHEVVHALQDIVTPQLELGIEQREYRALVVGFLDNVLEKKPTALFEAALKSLMEWQKQGRKFSADWTSAEWWLKNVDKITN
ncbi:MAG: hypothetical protein NTY75_02035 [Candidatus Shapirobacteria bacterium]|nr:hypothetical protein [Candidatus Shapirobacteria bacterium]